MTKKQYIQLPSDSARNIAVNCLLAFSLDRARIQDSLDAAFASSAANQRERPLATEIAYGACRQLITLDHLIARASSRPLDRIHPTLLAILRTGLYQLIYLTATPDYAVLDQAVRQAQTAIAPAAGGFVNAVLRSVQRDLSSPPDPAAPDQPRRTIWPDATRAVRFKTDIFPSPQSDYAQFLSLAYAHPQWLIQRWLEQHPPETVRAICLANNARPTLTLRTNRLRCRPAELTQLLTEAGLEFSCSDHTIQLHSPAVPEQLPGYHEGFFSVQDPTSIAVAPLLEPLAGQRILDLCAAPGGKTTHLAELMGDSGTIVACDIDPHRLARVDQNCRRLGISIVQTALPAQLDQLVRRDGPFDAVLVDVPCSNTGVFSRRVEARYLLQPTAFDQLPATQLSLLHQAATFLKEAAPLLYSTCSIEPDENQRVIDRFLAEQPSFTLAQHRLTLPSADSASLSDQTPPSAYHAGGYVALLYQS